MAADAKRSPLHATSLVSWLIAAFLASQACALPVHIGFAFLRGDEKAMTEGCDKKTCCTPLCYVDEHGKHHCVHKPGHSCKCGVSVDSPDTDLNLMSTIGILPGITAQLTALIPSGRVFQSPLLIADYHSPTPSPPPK